VPCVRSYDSMDQDGLVLEEEVRRLSLSGEDHDWNTPRHKGLYPVSHGIRRSRRMKLQLSGSRFTIGQSRMRLGGSSGRIRSRILPKRSPLSGRWLNSQKLRGITRISASAGATRRCPSRPRRSKGCTRMTSSWPRSWITWLKTSHLALRSNVAMPVTGLRSVNVEPGHLKDLERTRFRPEGIPIAFRQLSQSVDDLFRCGSPA
jgi:hypothetical protein